MNDITRTSKKKLRRVDVWYSSRDIRQVDLKDDGEFYVADDADVEIERLQREVTRLTEANEAWHRRVLLGAAHEPAAECRQCDELIGERDRAQDALQEAHIALGGDGEWSGKLPPQPAPDSGDLHLDVPELAREQTAELERLRAAQPPRSARYKIGDHVEWTNLLKNTFTGSVRRVDAEPRYLVQFSDGTVGHLVESELRPTPTKEGGQ